MKQPLLRFLMLLFSLPLWVQGVAASNGTPIIDYTLTVYEGNSYAQAILAETGNPGNYISVEEHSGSRYENLGHPGNIAYFDSPPILLGNALTALMRKLRTADPFLVSINVQHFHIFIAGYDEYADAYICKKMLENGSTAPGYINAEKAEVAGASGFCMVSDNGEVIGKRLKKDHFLEQVKGKLFVNGIKFDGEVVLTGDDRLHNASATETADTATDQITPDIAVVHATSCIWGDQIRGGKVVEGSGVTATTSRDGGYYQLGKKICTEHSKNVPDGLNAWSQFDDPVLAAMNSFPLAKGYFKAKEEHLFNRYKRGFYKTPKPTYFANEQGYMGVEILLNEAPYAFNDTLWKEAQNILTAYVIGEAKESEKNSQEKDSSVIDEIAVVIGELSKQTHIHTASGEPPRIRVVGEFPWKRLKFFPAIKQRLPSEVTDRLDLLTDSDYQLVTSKASQRYSGLYPALAKTSDEVQENQEPEETSEEAQLESGEATQQEFAENDDEPEGSDQPEDVDETESEDEHNEL